MTKFIHSPLYCLYKEGKPVPSEKDRNLSSIHCDIDRSSRALSPKKGKNKDVGDFLSFLKGPKDHFHHHQHNRAAAKKHSSGEFHTSSTDERKPTKKEKRKQSGSLISPRHDIQVAHQSRTPEISGNNSAPYSDSSDSSDSDDEPHIYIGKSVYKAAGAKKGSRMNHSSVTIFQRDEDQEEERDKQDQKKKKSNITKTKLRVRPSNKKK